MPSVIVPNSLFNKDCLKVLPKISERSIDLILCDLPYGITRNSWDRIIPLKPLWEEYRRVIKDKGVIVLTSTGIFSAKLILEAEDIYKYTIIWKKNKSRGFFNAKKQPLRAHEDILVFYKMQPTYHPQKTSGHTPVHSYTKYGVDGGSGGNYGAGRINYSGGGSTERYPTSILEIPVVNKTVHPTEKPVALGEWVISTFTNPGDIVLDNACGSGSFLVAAKNRGRKYIGIELEEKYYSIAKSRLEI